MTKYVSYCNWLISHSIMSSRFIHVVACNRFIHKVEKYFIVCRHPISFICSSINGHSTCSCLLAIVNHASMNMGVQISLWDPAFSSFGYMPRNGIARSYGRSIFNFGGTSIPLCVMVLFPASWKLWQNMIPLFLLSLMSFDKSDLWLLIAFFRGSIIHGKALALTGEKLDQPWE